MVSGPDGNERAWTSRRLSEDKRWDADAVVRVRGSFSGTEFELRITAEPEFDVQAGRPQVKPIPVMPFRVRNKDIAHCTWVHSGMQRVQSRKGRKWAAGT